MLYYNQKINKNGQELIKHVLLEAYIDNKTCSVLEFLTEPTLIRKLRETGIDLKIAVLPDQKIPVVVLPDSVIGVKGIVNTTSIYNFVSSKYSSHRGQPLDSWVVGVVDYLVSKLEVKREVILGVVKAAIKHLTILDLDDLDSRLPITIDLIDSDFFDETISVINEIDQKSLERESGLSSGSNRTLFQKECTDKFFIQIPDRLLFSDDVDYMQFIPKRESVCIPYTNDKAYTPLYKHSVPDFMIPSIVGNSKNNNLGIQDNEKEYYDALLNWIRNGIESDFPEVSVETEPTILDADSQGYLDDLLTSLYMWHWGHNPNVPISINTNTDDDKSDDTVMGRYVFFTVHTKESEITRSEQIRINAAILLQEFVKKACMKLGYHAYAEAVVKLARWGTRKPTTLTLEGYDQVFDLGTNQERAHVNLDDCTILADNGRTQSFDSFILDDVDLSHSGIGINNWSMPIGVVTNTILVNKNNEQLKVQTYYAMTDFINEIAKNGLKVAGVDFIDGFIKFTAEPKTVKLTELLTYYKENSANLLQEPFFRSRALKEILMQLGSMDSQGNSSINVLRTMHFRCAMVDVQKSIETNEFTSVEELSDKIRQISSIAVALEYNIVGLLLPFYLKVNSSYSGNLENAIGDWYQVLKEENFIDEVNFFSSRKALGKDFNGNPGKVQTVVKSPEPDVQRASGFGGSNKENKALISCLKIITNLETLHTLKGIDGNVIGYCSEEILRNQRTGKVSKTFTFVSPDEQKQMSNQVIDNNESFLEKMKEVMKSYIFVSIGKKPTMYFASKVSANYFNEIMNKEISKCLR